MEAQNQLQVKDDARLAVYGGLMDEAPVSAHDIVMPTLLFMQQMSKLVASDKAKSGQIVGSLEANLVADRGSSAEVIPFGFYKTWITFKTVNGQEEFVGVEPYTAANATRKREDMIEGVPFKNYETINYYVLIPGDIKTGFYLPYLIRFKSTAYRAGKQLETFRAKLAEFKKPHCFSTFQITTEQAENSKGQKYWVPKVSWGRDTTPEELKAVEHWYGQIKAGRVKADESDLKTTTEAEAPVNDPNFQV